MNFRPARAAAAATSSGVDRPSDRLVWMCRTPGIVPSANGTTVIRRGGSVRPVPKTQMAATRAAINNRKRRIGYSGAPTPAASKPGIRLQRRGLVGPLPGELRLGAAKVTERRRLLV